MGIKARKKKEARKQRVADSENNIPRVVREFQDRYRKITRYARTVDAELMRVASKKADVQRMQNDLNADLQAHLASIDAPADWSLDLFGTGLPKPTKECKLHPTM